MLLTSAERAVREGWEPSACIKNSICVGVDPDDGQLMGPAFADPRLLRSTGLALADMDTTACTKHAVVAPVQRQLR